MVPLCLLGQGDQNKVQHVILVIWHYYWHHMTWMVSRAPLNFLVQDDQMKCNMICVVIDTIGTAIGTLWSQ